MALVGKQQRKVGVNIILCNTQRTILLNGKLYAVPFKCGFCGMEC